MCAFSLLLMLSSSQERGWDVSLMFCGDFNSCPGNGVFEMVTSRVNDEKSLGLAEGIVCLLTFFPLCLISFAPDARQVMQCLYRKNEAPIRLESACGTPIFTNYAPGFHGCLDYIFVEKAKFLIDQVLHAFLGLVCKYEGINSDFRSFLCQVWKK